MMGIQQPQKELFSYQVDLDPRVRADHPLRRLNAVLDLSFVRAEVAGCYGVNGHVSVDPVVLVKLMILLFLEDIPSERELMARLDEPTTTPESYEAVAERTCSTTDPDATVVRKRRWAGARARYHHHRAVDDQCGVITAVETTTGAVAQNRRLLALAEQAEANTEARPETLVADRKYGTSENHVAAQQAGYRTHMADLRRSQVNPRKEGIFGEEEFVYDALTDTFRCPAGQVMKPRRVHPVRRTKEYITAAKVCSGCALRARCTRSRTGRTMHRHEHQELLDRAREQARGERARADRRRRQYLLEGSFADAANNHGFKRSRWRRLWRQQIQDWLIAAVQNWRILLREREGETRVPSAGVPAMAAATNLVVIAVGTWENPVRLAAGVRNGPKAYRWTLPEIRRRESYRDTGWNREPEIIHIGAE